ncbi:MAG: hypothetical protein Q9198_002007 [Flavoplaca austrocitrina]
MIPSYYRAAQKGKLEVSIHDEDWPVNATLRWLRLLYDWYVSHACGKYATSVIVIDSDDLINSPGFASYLCTRLGIDERHVRTKWERTPESSRVEHEISVRSFKATVWDSTGIIRGKRRDCDIDVSAEKEKLRAEFGDEIGIAMARYIDLTMEDYQYLRELSFVLLTRIKVQT